MKRTLLGLLFALGAGLPPASAAETLLLAAPLFPPYYELDENDQPVGPTVDQMRVVAGKAGYGLRVMYAPVNRIRRMLADGSADLTTLVLQHGLNDDQVWISENPIVRVRLNLYAIGRKPAINALEQLKDTRLIVMRNYSYGRRRAVFAAPERGLSLMEAQDFAQALMMLEAGRAPLALLYEANTQSGLAALRRPVLGLTHTTLSDLPVYVHVSRSSRSAEEKITRLRVALNAQLDGSK